LEKKRTLIKLKNNMIQNSKIQKIKIFLNKNKVKIFLNKKKAKIFLNKMLVKFLEKNKMVTKIKNDIKKYL